MNKYSFKSNIKASCLLALSLMHSTPVDAFSNSYQNTGGTVPDAAWSGDTPVLNGNLNVGALEGSGGVSGGAASYSIPIILPPGRAGMQPSVSLNYSSRSGNGIAGIGWGISSGSSIHRCGATFAQDRYTKSVTYGADDKLCLDGQRLIRIGGNTYGQSGAVYRTEIDDFSRITQQNHAINGAHPWFKVEHKDGRISIYGAWSDNLQRATGRSQVLSWNIGRVDDRSGNNIKYSYQNFGNGELLLKNINYTGTGEGIGDRKVEFNYQSRPDNSSSYMAGGLSKSTQRLQSIKTYYKNSLIRSYNLNYSQSLSTERSLLKSIQECSNGQCLLPTNFEWLESDTQYVLEKVPFEDHSKRWLDKALPHGDFNGDGIKDWAEKYINAEGEVTGSHSSYYSNCYRPQNGFTMSCLDADFNQDGKTDKFKKISNKLHIQYTDSSAWINTGIVWTQYNFRSVNSNGTTELAPKADYPMGFSDFNGDGLSDIAFFHTNGGNPQLRIYWNSGNHNQPFTANNYFLVHTYPVRSEPNSFCGGGTFASIYCNVNQSFQTDVQIFGDIDGNGISDFVIFEVQGGGKPRIPKPIKVILGHSNVNGYSTSVITPFANPAYSVYPNEFIEADFFADINGDGLTDWLSTGTTNSTGNHSVYLKLNKGGGQFESSWRDLGFQMPTRGGSIQTNGGLEPYMFPVQSKTLFMDYDGDGNNELLIADEVVASACSLVHSFNHFGAPISGWYCDDAMYRNYVQSVVGGARTPSHPTQINADITDDSVRKFDAIFFNESPNGMITTEKKTTDLMASATQFAAIDAYGNGLTDLVTVFGCRWAEGTDCKWNSNTSSHAYTVQDSSLTPGVWVMRNKGAARAGDSYQPIDMMLSAKDALSRKTEWTYKPLSTGTYKDSAGNNFYEVTHSYQESDPKYFHFASSMYAVASSKQSDGIGGMNETRYRYRGAMYNTQGRGFQGFKQIIVDDLSDSDLAKRVRSVSDFHQKFPLSGKLEQTRTCLVSSGSETCNSGLINKAYYKWDLWRDGVKKQTIDNAAEDFSAQVLDGQTSINRYWVSPYNQFSYDYLTKSGHNQAMTVSGWIHHTYQNFVFDSNGCQTYERKFSHEPGNVNRSEAVSNNYYHTPNTSSWWLCKPNYSLTTTKAVSGRATDYASVESGSDIQKQVKTTYVFDNTHRKLKTITTSATQGQGTATGLDSIANTSYNSYGLPTSVVSDGEHYTGADMADRNVSTTYTADGYFVNSVTNSKGHVTTTEVDPIHGQATKVTDPNLQETLMTYDAFGRVHSTKLPGEPTQYTAYWWCNGVNGGTAWCAQYANFKSKYRILNRAKGKPDTYTYYDMFNRNGYGITRNFNNDHWYYNRTLFNNKGQKVSEDIYNGGDSHGWQRTYFDSYDALGRLTKKRTPQSDGDHLPTIYQYDGFVTNINAGGLEMARKYNGLGQLVWTKDAAGNYTRYAYDGTGNPITLQDANGNPIYAKYNALGHKEYVDDPNMGKKFFWYNTFGEVEKEKDANLTELTYSYDTLGRMTQRWTNGTRSGYWYWDNGNVANYKGMLRWSYDGPSSTNARVKYHYYGKTTGGKLYETQTKYRHNESGSYTDYDIIHYVDNNFGRPKGMKYNTTGLTLAYDYNPQGYMSKIKNANGGYVYQEIKDLDNHGKVTRQLMGHGVMTQTASYDPATAQMTMIKSQKTSGATRLHELTYSYDDFSNLNMQVMVASNGVSNSEDYQYDSLHRLIQSDRTLNTIGQSDTITYNYDAVGNFSNKSDYGSNYLYGNPGKTAGGNAGPNAVRQLFKVGVGTVTFAYDNNGNMTSGDGKAITYNEFNKPLTIQKGSVTSSFSYGADLMRYKQVKTGAAGGTITTYYIDKLLEKEVQGSTTKYKHYIGDVAIQTKKNSTWEIGFTHRDRLGSVATISDENGNLKEHRSFDPFGKPRKGDFVEPSQNTFTSITGLTQMNRTTERGFTDHEHLDDHELIHMNGRAYDYNLGRFLSVDPFVQAPGNSQSMNPYSYIMNNPLAGTDPSGYKARKEGCPIRVCGSIYGSNSGKGGHDLDMPENLAVKAIIRVALVVDEVSDYVAPVKGVIKKGVKETVKVIAKEIKDAAKNKPKVDNGAGEKLKNTEKPEGVPKTVEKDYHGNKIEREPQTLQDQMAMDSAKKGEGQVKMTTDQLKDPKLKGTHEKMEVRVDSKEGKTTKIHYNREIKTGEGSDYKVKQSSNSKTGKDQQTQGRIRDDNVDEFK